MPAGRPSKKSTLKLDEVAKLARKGWTDAEMADFFEVGLSTWYAWKANDPKFQEALKEWKAEADARVERSLFERATGYSHPEDKIFYNSGEELVVPTVKHYAPDTTAAIFWLKNRQPERWRDKTEVDTTVKNDAAGMSDEDLNAEIARLRSIAEAGKGKGNKGVKK